MRNPKLMRVSKGELIITVDADVLAWNVHLHPHLQTDYGAPAFRVTDPVAFVSDVLAALEEEREDGSTLLTDMLDAAVERAIEDGSENVEEVA